MDAIKAVLQQAASEISTLDAEVLLAHVLSVPRIYLYTWPERRITPEELSHFNSLLKKRLQGEPVAYLTGHREFWSLDFIITKDVLIPRPETELLVELTLKNLPSTPQCIADLGTGSGAIALSLAKERPQWSVHATDISEAALNIAKQNAKNLQIQNIFFHQGRWCEALPNQGFDAILSNPPYIAEEDPECNEEVKQFEPHLALFSNENGLFDIKSIINNASSYLKKGGYLLLEHGYKQAYDVRGLLQKAGYTNIDSYQDFAGNERVTIATW